MQSASGPFFLRSGWRATLRLNKGASPPPTRDLNRKGTNHGQ